MDILPVEPAPPTLQRRGFLRAAGSSLAAGLAGASASAWGAAGDTGKVDFPRIDAPTEASHPPKPLPLATGKRVGYAIVGLGRLAVEQLLPAFAKTVLSKPTALVSGDRAKAMTLASHYGIDARSVYGYDDYDRLADNPAVDVIYVVLPNSMHAEFTVRGAKAGKHVLCEKPMANSVAECRQMIDACNAAGKKLMIAYRSQYEPIDRRIVKLVRDGKLGALRDFTAFNGQHQGDPNQWRLKRALSGGGSLPDVGVYCLNAARFLSGEEPVEVFGHTFATPGDPRFREVEETVHFTMRFPGGMVAQCGASYGTHDSKFMRLSGSLGWAEMSPAFEYNGLKLRVGSVADGHDQAAEPSIESGDQFAHEIDHMSRCVLDDLQPHTPGEEGLQDMRIVEAIYASARSGRVVPLTAPARPTRGPDPVPEEGA